LCAEVDGAPEPQVLRLRSDAARLRSAQDDNSPGMSFQLMTTIPRGCHSTHDDNSPGMSFQLMTTILQGATATQDDTSFVGTLRAISTDVIARRLFRRL
jgi:hypothetical protein